MGCRLMSAPLPAQQLLPEGSNGLNVGSDIVVKGNPLMLACLWVFMEVVYFVGVILACLHAPGIDLLCWCGAGVYTCTWTW